MSGVQVSARARTVLDPASVVVDGEGRPRRRTRRRRHRTQPRVGPVGGAELGREGEVGSLGEAALLVEEGEESNVRRTWDSADALTTE